MRFLKIVSEGGAPYFYSLKEQKLDIKHMSQPLSIHDGFKFTFIPFDKFFMVAKNVDAPCEGLTKHKVTSTLLWALSLPPHYH